MFLLDTDVVSNFVKQKPHPRLVEWLQTVDPVEIATSLGTIFEIQMGIEAARRSHPARAEEKERWLEGLLDTRSVRVIAPDVDVARLQAKMFSTPALRNFVVPEARARRIKTGVDLTIAATAIVHQATVVTFNVGDFVRIDRHFPLPAVFDPGAQQFAVGPRGNGAFP